MDMGIFIPNGRNGYIISKATPQFDATFDNNLEFISKCDDYGLEFALAMIKFRGFGGDTGFWNNCLEGFTLLSAVAARTKNVKLFASTGILALHPAMAARMTATIDSVAPGRIGVNIVTGWQPAEYDQMGVWPGDEYFGFRYDYASEYVQIMRDLWETGACDLRGQHFTMKDCRMQPQPKGRIDVVAAGQSPRGMQFAAQYADYNFTFSTGINTPTAFAPTNKRLMEATAETGRDVGSYVLVMVVADETDALAEAKWQKYVAQADDTALSWMAEQSGRDTKADAAATVNTINLPAGRVNMNMGTLVGSYEKVAGMLDEVASVPGTKGIMLAFDDFFIGMDQFGQEIQPKMRCREARLAAA